MNLDVLRDILGSIALGAAGALSLWGLYRALEFKWPEQYVSLNDTFALGLVHTWWRLLIYRFVPVFFAGIAIWATTSRLGFNPPTAVVIMVLIHILHTNVPAAVRSLGLGQGSREFTVNYASYHFLTLLIVAGAAISSVSLAPMLRFLVPQPQVLLDSLWIAVFIAVAGGIAVSIIGKRPDGSRPFDSHYYVWRAKRDVGLDLIDYAYEQALRHQCDPILLRAIMFTEALQRPGWVRRLELLKGRLLPRGSYGVTQERSDRPLTDREAIERTALKMSGRWGLTVSSYGFGVDNGRIWKHAAFHNEGIAFIDGVQEIYRSIMYGEDSTAYITSIESLHVIEVRRYPHSFRLRAISGAASLTFMSMAANSTSNYTSIERPPELDAWKPWALELEFDPTTIALSVDADGDGMVDLEISHALAIARQD